MRGDVSVITSVSFAVHSALIKDLPDIAYLSRKPGTRKPDGTYEEEERFRRPYKDDCEVFVFPQTWGSTALGFGGAGGQAMTMAYTTIVSIQSHAAVYFGGRLAYVVANPNQRFWEHVAQQSMVAAGGSHAYVSEG